MAQADPGLSEWSILKKLLFCFFLIFFIGYIFLNPNEVVPFSYYLHQLYIRPCNHLIEWLAKGVFHIVSPAIVFYNGTIDSVFGYVTLLFIFVIALSGAFLWVWIDRKSPNYNNLYKILILVLRYYLAITWIAYGAMKIIKLQFPPLSPEMLLQTYGNSTPKELAWAFMGYSTGYNYFIGLTECAVGLFLFFRRTSAFGNTIALGILANVVAFNYSYDVNVKMLTTVLLLMTLFLLSKDITRLVNFFFLNKAVQPTDDPPFRFKNKRTNTAYQISKYGFILFILLFDLHRYTQRVKQQGTSNIKPPLYGIYDVITFIRNKDTIKPLTTDTTRWNKLIITSPPGNASIMLMNYSLKSFVLKADTAKNKIELCAKTDTSDKYTFIYTMSKDSVMVLQGKWRNDSLKISLRQHNLKSFPIMNHNFRWVLDRNFNKKLRPPDNNKKK